MSNALALVVGNAPVGKDIRVAPLTLPDISASYRARRKAHVGKQNESSWSRCAINFRQENTYTIAIHLELPGGCGHRCWEEQSWEEEQG